MLNEHENEKMYIYIYVWEYLMYLFLNWGRWIIFSKYFSSIAKYKILKAKFLIITGYNNNILYIYGVKVKNVPDRM